MILPAGIDESGISADLENGLPEITVLGGSAAEVAEPQRMEIRDRSRDGVNAALNRKSGPLPDFAL
jgi:hypothetical protein